MHASALRVPVAVAAALVLALGLSGCGAVTTAGKDLVRRLVDPGAGSGDSGSGSGSGGTNIGALDVGDCFDDPDDDSGDVTIEDCTDPHDDEITAIIDLAGSDYPGDISVDKQARELCERALARYVGVSFDDSVLDFGYFPPDQTSWRNDDRAVLCYAYNWSYDPLDRSVEGAGI